MVAAKTEEEAPKTEEEAPKTEEMHQSPAEEAPKTEERGSWTQNLEERQVSLCFLIVRRRSACRSARVPGAAAHAAPQNGVVKEPGKTNPQPLVIIRLRHLFVNLGKRRIVKVGPSKLGCAVGWGEPWGGVQQTRLPCRGYRVTIHSNRVIYVVTA